MRMGLVIAWLLCLPSFGIAWSLATTRWRMLRRRRVPFDALSDETRVSLSSDGLALAQAGFELVSPIRVEDFETSTTTYDGYHLSHRVLNVHAFLRRAPASMTGSLLTLESFYGDPAKPALLATLHERFAGISFASERATLDYQDAPDVHALLQAHLQRRDIDPRAPLDLGDDAALEASQGCWSGWLTDAKGRRYWRPSEAGFEPTVRAYLELPWRWRFDGTTARSRAQIRGASADRTAAACHYHYEASARRWRSELPWRFVLVLGSGLAVFVAGFVALTPGAGPLVAAGLLTILLHELGHVVALRACGVPVRGPSLGGVVKRIPFGTGLAREAFIVLCGPVPGMLLGAGLLTWARLARAQGDASNGIALLWTLGTVLLVVNAVSLLPLVPYDGGRLLHRVLLGRPYAFAVVSSALAIGLLLIASRGAFPMLALLAVVPFLIGWRDARHERALRALPSTTEAAWRHRVIERLYASGYRTLLPATTRHLELRLAAGPSTGLGRTALAGIYGVALTIGWWSIVAADDPVDVDWPIEPQRWVACDGEAPHLDEGLVIFGRAASSSAREIRSSLSPYTRLHDYCIGGPWDDPYAGDTTMCAERSIVAGIAAGDAELAREEASLARAMHRAETDPDAYDALAARLGADCDTRSRIYDGPWTGAGVVTLLLEDASQRDDAARWLCERGLSEVGSASPSISWASLFVVNRAEE